MYEVARRAEALLTLGIRSWVGVPTHPCPERWLLSASLQAQFFRPESRQDYPPNLSILISGGKENNCDALSNGE